MFLRAIYDTDGYLHMPEPRTRAQAEFERRIAMLAEIACRQRNAELAGAEGRLAAVAPPV